jgi:hypothetical protein
MNTIATDPKDTSDNSSEENNTQNEEKVELDDNFSSKNSFDCEYDNWSPD